MFACKTIPAAGGDAIVSAIAHEFRNGSSSVRFLSNFRWQFVMRQPMPIRCEWTDQSFSPPKNPSC
jgi:hypothetical protein